MLFWILVAVLTAGVAAVLLYPLLRGAKAAEQDRAGEAAVYRDQLRELDRDLADGLISEEETEYARAEIGRRLLAAANSEPPGKAPTARHYRLTEAFVILVLPVVGLCLYLTTGSPGLPSQPLQARLENPGNDMGILIAKAERHLAQNPDDGQGWEILAPIYFRTMRLDDAETAYRNSIRLLGPTPARLNGLAETLMTASDGVVTADARAALEQSLKLEANNPRASFYLALALEQDGKADAARAAFENLAKQSPADAPWLPLVNQHIARNGGATAAEANAQAPAGPTDSDVAAAENMTTGDRQQMIRGMVENLDARLTQNPDNFDGWMQLVRSYAVLNDKDRAADALKRGLAAFPADGTEGKQLLALAQELGISMENSPQ
jgi:cytochrome c-type biogenesis protein CcmH